MNRAPSRSLLTTLALLATLGGLAPRAHAEPKTLTIATLAPERSAWDRVFTRMVKEIEEKTGGSVHIKVYKGGVQGDEEVVVRKMRSGQVDGASLTGIGLGKVAPNVLILQLPMFFRNYGELDEVRRRLDKRWHEEFEKNGFVLLGWGEVGYYHLFSKVPIREPKDLTRVKMWVWSADPLAGPLYRAAGGSPVALGLPEVRQALETGLVDAFPNSPLGAIALRWYTRVKYMTADPVSIGIAATVVRKDAWARLSPDEQRIVREVAEKWHRVLIKKVRKDNAKAQRLLQKHGIEVVKTTETQRKFWLQLAHKVHEQLAGKVFDRALFEEVRRIVESMRK